MTENHLALIHSSWRHPRKDAEFGRPMFAFHVVLQATEAVLDRVESVRYSLHPSYPNPIQTVTDRGVAVQAQGDGLGESRLSGRR